MSDPRLPQVVRIRRSGHNVIQDCDIYIGRVCYRGGWELQQSIWANPFSVKSYDPSTNQQACLEYERYIRNRPDLPAQLPTLYGKRLGCWCLPEPCHGMVLVKLVNERLESESNGN